jgi:hypothetical protein
MEKIRTIFMVLVAAIVLVLFGAGIYVAARYTLWVEGAPRPNDMPGIVSYFVSAVNGTLAANLGAVLGISISLRGWQAPRNTTELLQWIAAGWYLVMLLLATAFWGLAGFTEDETKVVSVLPEMTKNAIGIFIAVLAAVLGLQTAITRARGVEAQEPGRV